MSPTPVLHAMTPVLHATTLARRVDGRWRGVLVRGPSGAGKSDLALRALGQGWRLVADDRTLVWTSGGRLYGRAPAALSGLLEATGIGIARMAALAFVPVALVVDAADTPVERIPDPETETLLGVALPRLRLCLHQAAAPAKIALALHRLWRDAARL